jgi:hypothetical protein
MAAADRQKQIDRLELLEAAFRANGGRRVEMAEEIDQLRSDLYPDEGGTYRFVVCLYVEADSLEEAYERVYRKMGTVDQEDFQWEEAEALDELASDRLLVLRSILLDARRMKERDVELSLVHEFPDRIIKLCEENGVE